MKQGQSRSTHQVPTLGAELDARRVQRLQTRELLQTARTPLQVVAVADAAAGRTDQAIANLPRSPRPSACQEGCAWCCYRKVGVAAAEVIRIVRYVAEQFTPAEAEALRDRVTRLAEQRRTLPDPSRLPCPLLHDNRCSVYAVRPLTCRGYNSADADACAQWVKTGKAVPIPKDERQQRLATFILDGLRAGLQEVRLQGDLLELTAALRMAMTNANVAEDWLQGKPSFAAARMP